MSNPETQTAAKENKKDEQSQAARKRLCEATIWCLDKYGYSDASISRITEKAAVSRGALTHHYPSKEDLIVDAMDRMLTARRNMTWPSMRATGENGAMTRAQLKEDLLWNWRQLDTREGRAMLEVLVAARTDQHLKQRIADNIEQWNGNIKHAILELTSLPEQEAERLMQVWDLVRVFYRGLLLHKNFESDTATIDKLAEQFVDLIAPKFGLPQD